MCIPMAAVAVGTLVIGAIGAGLAAVSAQRQVEAGNRAAEYNAKINERNAEIANLQAVDAEQRGAAAVKNLRIRIARLKGSQRAAAAASGVVVDTGSPLDVLQDTEFFGEVDAMTIRENAAREAWGFRTQAGGFVAQARLSRAKKGDPRLAGVTSLLTGVSRLGSQFGSFQRAGVL